MVTAGVKLARIEIENTGKIVLFPSDAVLAVPEANEWDSVKK
jgi:hypothetical protein